MRFILASFLFLLALPCFFAAAYLYLRRIRRWSRTRGEIKRVSIRSSKHLTVKGHLFYHQILVVVGYMLHEQSYERLVNPQTTADDLPLAQELAETRYSPHKQVVIYYSKTDPEEITLRPDEEWDGVAPRLALAGLVTTAVAVLLAL